MKSFDVTIPWSPDESVSGVLAVPQGFEPGRTSALIVAHGAGNDMHNPLLVHFTQGLGEKSEGGNKGDPVVLAKIAAIGVKVDARGSYPAWLCIKCKS